MDFKKSFLDYTRYSLKLRKLIKAIEKTISGMFFIKILFFKDSLSGVSVLLYI